MRTGCLGMIVAVIAVLLMAGAAFGERGVEQAKAEFEQADIELNAAWSRVKAALDERRFAKVQVEQRQWIKDRDRWADYVAELGKVGDQGIVHWTERTRMTRMRTEILNAIAKPVQGDDPWTGRWIDGGGGTLLIQARESEIQFRIDVVRGPTYHLGYMAGVAPVNENLARFTDAQTADQAKRETLGETWLTFMRRNDRLELLTANTGYYHGARAYFYGEYYRVAPLTDEERAAVIEGRSQK